MQNDGLYEALLKMKNEIMDYSDEFVTFIDSQWIINKNGKITIIDERLIE